MLPEMMHASVTLSVEKMPDENAPGQNQETPVFWDGQSVQKPRNLKNGFPTLPERFRDRSGFRNEFPGVII